MPKGVTILTVRSFDPFDDNHVLIFHPERIQEEINIKKGFRAWPKTMKKIEIAQNKSFNI